MRRLLALSAAALTLGMLAAPGAGAASLERMVAPVSACPGQGDASASAGDQERAMVCMTNFARRAAGLRGFRASGDLSSSAGRKSGDIVRCDDFSHYACHRDFTFWMKRVGFIAESCWRAGENIAWGTRSYATVHSIFLAWMRSPGHRDNILGSFGVVGIGLRVGSLDGHRDAHVWTQHFGSYC